MLYSNCLNLIYRPFIGKIVFLSTALLLSLVMLTQTRIIMNTLFQTSHITASHVQATAISSPNVQLFGQSSIEQAHKTIKPVLFNGSITGILFSTKNSEVILTMNGVQDTYKEGDRLANGSFIQAIKPDHIVLSQNGVAQIYALPNEALQFLDV